MRIAYVTESLSYCGGVERIISDKANYLADRVGYDVCIIVCYGFSEPLSNAFSLSDRVRLFFLDVPYHSHYHYRYPRRLFEKWRLKRLLKQRLEETIAEIAPDIVLCPSCNFANIVCRLPGKAVKVIESHEARLFTKSGHLFGQPLMSRLFMYVYRKFYLRTIERYADVVVTLTQGDANEWRNARRVEIIPDFTLMPTNNASACNQRRAIAVGRLTWQKGFDRLIRIWQIVSKRYPEWQLNIYGSGELEQELNQTIHEAGLTNVSIYPFTNDICGRYAESSFFLLTSRFEGFALVLLEAMCHGLPCVAFDCHYGPADIIVDGSCGYVVEDGDIEAFANKVCGLIEDTDRRLAFSAAALRRSEAYNVDTIMQRWVSLFDNLVSHCSAKTKT